MTQNEDIAIEALLDFLNAVDAGITHARETIKKHKGISTVKSGTWNPASINWQNTDGQKGPYEKSVDYDNLQHKAMLADLESHDGKLQRDGFFLLAFQRSENSWKKKAKLRTV